MPEPTLDVPDAGQLLCELLRRLPHLKLLVTSHGRLHVSPEALLPLSGRDRAPHHGSLRAALDQSWRRLSEEERGALRRLSVLRGAFTREAAQHAAGVSLDVLATLADLGLIRSTPFGRFELHQLTASYAAGRLAQLPDERLATERRYLDFEMATPSIRPAEIDFPSYLC